ncbi:MAG: hypothetical protein U1D30_08840 [Planctomycetota bacterium]
MQPSGPVPTEIPDVNGKVAPTPSSPRLSRWKQWVTVGIFVSMFGTVGVFAFRRPAFYVERLHAMPNEERTQLSKQFLNKGTRLINDIQNEPIWLADFDERQINAWLADDFHHNHAEQTLPSGIREPRIAIEGDMLRLGFQYCKGPCGVVIQIGFRAWVPKRNMLAVEIEGAWAGDLPLPASYTRSVIEQFTYANNLGIRWKRNGSRLVALIEFPKGHREVVLQKVEIRSGTIHVKGGSGRLPVPSTDYAPSAN